MATLSFLLVLLIIVNVVLLLSLVVHQRSRASQADGFKSLVYRTEGLEQALTQRFSAATADLASRLEQTKGDLRQQVSDRLGEGFTGVRQAVDRQMTAGRQEQAERLLDGAA